MRALLVVGDTWERDYLSVTVRVSWFCADNYTVVVAFGTQLKTGGGCTAQVNATTAILSPGESKRFFTDSFPLAANQIYCYLINDVPYAFTSPSPTPEGPSSAEVALSHTILMILLLAVALA